MKKLLIGFIKIWRLFFSPLYPASCKYHPTCSEYALLAVEKYGIFKGSFKAIYRILRCNPFAKGGIDYP